MLNGKLSEAQNLGITLDIVKAEAPSTLPIDDTDLCSLVMNIMNNAIKAASASDAPSPFIHLNLHVRNNYFAFTCQNSANIGAEKNKTVRGHGLGLKIIGEITEKYNGIIKNEYTDGTYEIKLAIPLSTPVQADIITV